jgi:7,8-dihydro-6-hydroxymethylpterin-pyrophosphokinase
MFAVLSLGSELDDLAFIISDYRAMKKQQVDKVIADIWTSFAQETFPLGPHNEQQFLV